MSPQYFMCMNFSYLFKLNNKLNTYGIKLKTEGM